jgi:pyruvate formate lyase activating enzyme
MPDSYQLIKTRLQTPLDNGDVVCNLCLWRCRLRHGQRGFCQAHVNRNGVLYNLSYGIISAIDVGAIEDKPVYHYRSGTKVMSIGSYGCNFRCKGCHNLDISWGVQALDKLARGESTDAWVKPEEVVQMAKKNGVEGIAFTYSEPAVWMEYVIDVSALAKEAGLYTVYVSNSYVTDEALAQIAPYIDVLCSDIKSLSNEFYRDICPTSDVCQVLASIKKAQELGIHVETRTNIIPGKNDDPQELKNIAEWIRNNLGVDSPWHVTKFFPAYQLAHLPETPHEIIEMAADQGKAIGLKHVYAHTNISCDCASENVTVNDWLGKSAKDVQQSNRCSANCCGSEGILVKKFEREAGLTK